MGRIAELLPATPMVGSDIEGPQSRRKVTFAFSLTSTDGAAIWLPAGSSATVDSAGGLSAWLAFRPWGLTPLVEGERLFVLGRLHGPPFQ